MSEIQILLWAERNGAETVEIRENDTGKTGIAESCPEGIRLFYGADDGSDDKTVTTSAFNRDFTVYHIVWGDTKPKFLK